MYGVDEFEAWALNYESDAARWEAEGGYPFAIDSPTNQIFIALSPEQKKKLTDKVSLSFWENLPDGRIVMRIATSWATTEEDVNALCALLKESAR